MCCHKNPNETRIVKKILANSAAKGVKKVKFWKVIHLDGRALYGRTNGGRSPRYVYSPGYSTKIDIQEYNLCRPRGYHVYRNSNEATKYLWWYLDNSDRDLVLLPVYGELRDFLVADNKQAVFRRVFIYKKDWIKAGLPVRRSKK